MQLFNSGNLVQQIYTSNTGEYTFATDTTGSYTVVIDTSGSPFSFACPASGYQVDSINLNDTIDVFNNFGLVCTNADYQVASISTPYLHPFRSNIVTRVELNIGNIASTRYNAGCTGGASGIVTTIFSGPITYFGPDARALTP